MKRLSGALVALTLLIAACSASAAEIRGMLEAADPVGDRVVVIYEEEDGQKIATAVRKADH